MRLFPPEAFPRLYPFPMGHPQDRQSQVTLPATPGSLLLDSEEDRRRFPTFEVLPADNSQTEVFADLGPGDVLFVPQYWWHQMEALTNNTSLSWWYKDTARSKKAVSVDAESGRAIVDPSSVNLIAVRRNVEKLIMSSIGGKSHFFFLALASGVLDFASEPSSGPADPWEPLAVDREKQSLVAANFDPSWRSVLQQILSLVRMIPQLESWRAAVKFMKILVQGRFNALESAGV